MSQSSQKKLDLTPAQQEKAKAIFIDAKAKNEALDEKYNLKAYKAEKQDLQKASHKAMSDILTAEQRQKLQAMKKKSKAEETEKLRHKSFAELKALPQESRVTSRARHP